MKKAIFLLFLLPCLIMCSCDLSNHTPTPSPPLGETYESDMVLPSITALPSASTDISSDELTETIEIELPWFIGAQVPNVITIDMDGFPIRYDLDEVERSELWTMIQKIECSPVCAEDFNVNSEVYSDTYRRYSGYCRIDCYFQDLDNTYYFQLYRPDTMRVTDGDFRYDPTTLDFSLIEQLCSVPPTIYEKDSFDIESATIALSEFLSTIGRTPSKIWYDESICSAIFDERIHTGPAGGKNTVAKPENCIILLYEFICGPDGGGAYPGKEGDLVQNIYAQLVRNSSEDPWEFVIDATVSERHLPQNR